MNIHQLIDKYFEGETSYREEEMLRTFFSTENVPEDLLKYKPIFDYFSLEKSISEAEAPKKRNTRRIVLYALSAVASCALLVLSITHFMQTPDTYCGENYVIINGTCYTDIETIRLHAQDALKQISDTNDETSENTEGTIGALDYELEELRKLFTSEE